MRTCTPDIFFKAGGVASSPIATFCTLAPPRSSGFRRPAESKATIGLREEVGRKVAYRLLGIIVSKGQRKMRHTCS